MTPRPAGAWATIWASAPALMLVGALHGLSFAPAHAWWLQLGCLAWLVAAARGAAPRRAALLGWCFAFGWLASGLWWLYISMHDYGGLPPWLAAAAVAALAAALALYYAVALAAWARWGGGRSAGLSALGFVGAFTLAELARATVFTGFPWIASGYAHSVGPLAGWAPYVGVYGLGALAAAVACAMAAWWPGVAHSVEGRRAVSGLAVAVLALGPWLPAEFTRSTGRLSVSLLQPNVSQDLKFDPDRLAANLRQLIDQVGAARGQVVVTPESVVPLARGDLGDAVWEALHAPFRASGRGVLVGIFVGDAQQGYVNSMVGLSQAPEYVYGKRHLLPFGEFIPPGFGWFVRMMNIPLGDQARGTQTAPFEVAGQRLRPLICYEDLFGEDFVDSVRGPQAATVLVNASNLAWFGRWMVQDQHLQFSQMRALEFQRPVVRATNTGATAVVDHTGRVMHRLPPLSTGVLEATVEGRVGDTPYAQWLGRFGLWPVALLAAVAVGLSGRVDRRAPRAPRP